MTWLIVPSDLEKIEQLFWCFIPKPRRIEKSSWFGTILNGILSPRAYLFPHARQTFFAGSNHPQQKKKHIFQRVHSICTHNNFCLQYHTIIHISRLDFILRYTMFLVYAVSIYAVLHLCGSWKWSIFLLYAAIFSHYAVFGQNHST